MARVGTLVRGVGPPSAAANSAAVGNRSSGSGADGARDPEVGDDRMVAREENVLGLDVAVDDALPVGVAERVGDVAGDPERLVEREPALAPQAMAQRLSLEVRHDVVEQPRRLARREDWHDVRVAELRGKVDFADEPLAPQAGGYLPVEHLDRDPAR